MENVLPRLIRDYRRVTARYEEIDPFAGEDTLGLFVVLRAHYLIVDYFASLDGEDMEPLAIYGPKDLGLLESALSRPLAQYGGKRKWTADLDKCATLFFGLVKNHAFHDGNKRTAFLALLYNLWRLGRVPSRGVRGRDFEQLAVRAAASELGRYRDYRLFERSEDPEICFISSFLSARTRRTNERQHAITYRQLNGLLKKRGFELNNARNNFIDVVRLSDGQKLLQVGFPGWGRQINVKAIHSIRRATQLDKKSGVDSEVFYNGADPLDVLIPRFHGVLKRLADS